MCCENKSARDAYAPTGTWLDRTDNDTFTADQLAAAEGCVPRTIQRRVEEGLYGELPYWSGGTLMIPRWAVIHSHWLSRQRRKARGSASKGSSESTRSDQAGARAGTDDHDAA